MWPATALLCVMSACAPALAAHTPVVVVTWDFVNASVEAWKVLESGGSALDAVQRGAAVCEALQCDGTVGYGGSPAEDGETTLDALLMDGRSMNVGAVGALRRVKDAVGVARHVLDHTRHSILVGELATQFALQMGFPEESLTTAKSKKMWMKWHNDDHCQPNFWTAVRPDPGQQCGPYEPARGGARGAHPRGHRRNHDTIALVAVDARGDVAAGTSTNGARFKIPGRIGDSPIPGAGAYADNEVGAAAATGDGDLMLRFLPSFLAVELMRGGAKPGAAAAAAVARVARHYPQFMGGVVAVSARGEHAAACHGVPRFPYMVASAPDGPRLHTVPCQT